MARKRAGRGPCLAAGVCLGRHGLFGASPSRSLMLFLRMRSRDLVIGSQGLSLARSALGPLYSPTGKGKGKRREREGRWEREGRETRKKTANKTSQTARPSLPPEGALLF